MSHFAVICGGVIALEADSSVYVQEEYNIILTLLSWT